MSVACGNPVHADLRFYLGFDPEALNPRRATVHHASAADVRRCYATEGGIPTLEDADLQAETAAECAAEAGFERWLEDGGPHAASIAADLELERRIEASRGVVPFDVASERGQVCSGDVHGPTDDECRGAHCVQPTRPTVCPHHGVPLDATGCWECNAERAEAARDRAEDERVARFKMARDGF